MFENNQGKGVLSTAILFPETTIGLYVSWRLDEMELLAYTSEVTLGVQHGVPQAILTSFEDQDAVNEGLGTTGGVRTACLACYADTVKSSTSLSILTLTDVCGPCDGLRRFNALRALG